MITSFINGRVRLRDPRFKDEETCAVLEELLKDHPGVTRVTANPRTGGLLIEYDPDRVSLDEAKRLLTAAAPEGAQWLEDYECALGGCSIAVNLRGEDMTLPPPPSPGFGGFRRLSPEAAEYLTMTGAFIVCTGSAFLRSKNLHIYSGLTLAGLTAQHIWKFRKRIAACLNLRLGGPEVRSE